MSPYYAQTLAGRPNIASLRTNEIARSHGLQLHVHVATCRLTHHKTITKILDNIIQLSIPSVLECAVS